MLKNSSVWEMLAHVEAIGIYKLYLEFGCFLDLEETYYVLLFRQNLISISCLDKSSYSCSFGNGKFSLHQYSKIVGTGYVINNLYKLDLHVLHMNEALHVSDYGTKHNLINEKSSMLWHKRLGHISKQRIERLLFEGILNSLDFSEFGTCIECIKGKQTNIKKLGSYRTSDVLEVIHIDICGPFPMTS